MIIAGLQTLSLIDYPGVISAVIFTQGCVFRCPYCHNPELIPRESSQSNMSTEEVLTTLCRHKNMIEGVCITGGEPTMHHDLPDLIRALKQERFLVKLDTNGIHPTMIKQLIDEHAVDYLAMDLKHVWKSYDEVIRTEGARSTENCRQTFELIQGSHVAHEFRTTVCPELHTEEDIIQIASQLKQGERYILQPIRYGKTLDTELKPSSPLNYQLLMEKIRVLRPDLELRIR